MQFAIMGSVAAETLLGVDEPRVGLLNIGEEKGKGRDLEKAAYARNRLRSTSSGTSRAATSLRTSRM